MISDARVFGTGLAALRPLRGGSETAIGSGLSNTEHPLCSTALPFAEIVVRAWHSMDRLALHGSHNPGHAHA